MRLKSVILISIIVSCLGNIILCNAQEGYIETKDGNYKSGTISFKQSNPHVVYFENQKYSINEIVEFGIGDDKYIVKSVSNDGFDSTFLKQITEGELFIYKLPFENKFFIKTSQNLVELNEQVLYQEVSLSKKCPEIVSSLKRVRFTENHLKHLAEVMNSQECNDLRFPSFGATFRRTNSKFTVYHEWISSANSLLLTQKKINYAFGLFAEYPFYKGNLNFLMQAALTSFSLTFEDIPYGDIQISENKLTVFNISTALKYNFFNQKKITPYILIGPSMNIMGGDRNFEIASTSFTKKLEISGAYLGAYSAFGFSYPFAKHNSITLELFYSSFMSGEINNKIKETGLNLKIGF